MGETGWCEKLRQTGFSLVEIMVGMAIGLLAVLVITQVFIVFEGQKRSTTGTASGQSNGSVALYTIGRELQIAGYGLLPVTDSPLECNPVPSIGGISLDPVIITDGGGAAGASDTIAIRYGPSPMGGIPSMIKAMVGTIATVDTNLGCRVGDTALIINGAACVMTTVTGPTDIAIPPVATVPADLTHVVLQSATGVLAGANLACLGAWSQSIFAVNNGNLERNGVPIIAGVVNMQAQYGISASANSNQITQWVEATAATGWNTPSVANRNRIKGVRVAVVARNGQYEKDVVSSACSSRTSASPTGLCAWDATSANPAIASPAPAINLANDADWNHYRYRVFETIIPLRNVIWSKASL